MFITLSLLIVLARLSFSMSGDPRPGDPAVGERGDRGEVVPNVPGVDTGLLARRAGV